MQKRLTVLCEGQAIAARRHQDDGGQLERIDHFVDRIDGGQTGIQDAPDSHPTLGEDILELLQHMIDAEAQQQSVGLLLRGQPRHVNAFDA